VGCTARTGHGNYYNLFPLIRALASYGVGILGRPTRLSIGAAGISSFLGHAIRDSTFKGGLRASFRSCVTFGALQPDCYSPGEVSKRGTWTGVRRDGQDHVGLGVHIVWPPRRLSKSPDNGPVTVTGEVLCYGGNIDNEVSDEGAGAHGIQASIVRAERNYEGRQWVVYDRQYRWEALASKDLNWSVPNVRLYNEAFTGQQEGLGLSLGVDIAWQITIRQPPALITRQTKGLRRGLTCRCCHQQNSAGTTMRKGLSATIAGTNPCA